MLFYIIPFEKRFCSYLKLPRHGGCGGAGAHTWANKHAPGCLASPSLRSVYSVVLTWKDAYWMLQSLPTELLCFFVCVHFFLTHRPPVSTQQRTLLNQILSLWLQLLVFRYLWTVSFWEACGFFFHNSLPQQTKQWIFHSSSGLMNVIT